MESSASIAKATSGLASRRSWSFEEETVLVEGLKDLLLRGWKADNGFKSGYAMILEKHMQQHFPGTDIKAEPHITSKMHVWKKNYASLSMMQSRSGFGWNDTSNTITVDKEEIWSDYIKFDPHAKTMRYKTWPFFKDWIDIFGKDRATGEHAQGFADAADGTQSDSQPDPTTGVNTQPLKVGEEASAGFRVDEKSGTQGESSSATRKRKTKKRNANDVVEEHFLDLMESFCAKTEGHLRDLAQRICFQQDAKQQRKAVFDVLNQMPFLSIEDKLTISTMLFKNNEDLDLFFSISDEYKAVMVKMILEGRL
ncbi:hypothetical protein PHJA_000994100 [Phtheirospermum japonicum]|uniref:Myb/SANT-like domain-containing protein n=1 Tax=Phtheirospermum japonicum TaxID=374723 RepID=A0A830BVX2_9LAMI|nr:hypothetical protein PHJA_000994100 [Phtheirospermum japonicum]